MRILHQVDSFTRTPFTGNPAGVVLDADGMTDADMLAVARELNNSETAFVLPPDGADHDVRVRFFTPTTEVPTCGHATVGAHFARAVEYGLPSGSLVQKTGGGLRQRVEIIRDGDGDRVRIGMHQGAADFGPELDGTQVDRLLRALGATSGDLADDGPVQIVSTGHSKVIVELCDRAAVDGLRPDPAALTALSHEVGSNGWFVFTRATGEAQLLTWARMFAPAIGIAEDPVTGNGHGPLGAYLVHHGIVPAPGGRLDFTGRQGVAMGRPGEVGVWVDVRSCSRRGGELLVSITGDATTAFRARLNA
ncbi:PhzF family phenazine biosynthesis isomerase [Streptomyces sp. NBC_01381]|uniref:PhzF family phenazine biosynthesis isomerase n=1 Tax=Streptomyces sp. NBC_01381 TaxID=2903845 RepID=UPI0022599811|nr:PhzF family phenazine biosynthesis isomerase [Streptomyces sp. NBC_01381]MCX4672194.1 PhzF family phenazine biosynthesis isomerase [Streptomyces sp. NBC_01381]